MSLDLDNFWQLPRVSFILPTRNIEALRHRLSCVQRCVKIPLQVISKTNLSRWRKILLRPKPTPVEAGFVPREMVEWGK
jgi:hypothetical protein